MGLGRFSVVGTTVRTATLPEHLLADEHHQGLDGQKIYIATTVGNGCCLGAEPAEAAGSDKLKVAYQVFKDEACDSKYSARLGRKRPRRYEVAAARRVKSPRRIDRGEVLEAGISGRSVTYPVRLRSSVSWAIQVFRPDCFGSGCGIFSS